jgi:hypothetical protein
VTLQDRPEQNPRNTAGCCDGRGQVHWYGGALAFVSPCREPVCVARREAAMLRWLDGLDAEGTAELGARVNRIAAEKANREAAG